MSTRNLGEESPSPAPAGAQGLHGHARQHYRANKAWPDPTPEMLTDPEFDAIWEAIKTWDINVPGAYSGYCGATGNHVRAILECLRVVNDSRSELLEACQAMTDATEMLGPPKLRAARDLAFRAMGDRTKDISGLRGQRDETGRFIYFCDECGAECTAGAPAGPATTHLDGVTRCHDCSEEHDTDQGSLLRAAPDLLEACRRLVGAIEALAVATSGGPPANWTAIDVSQDAARAAIRKASGREGPRETPDTQERSQP